MEKKKLLLVAVSVGVFLVIVVGAAILVFSAKEPAAVAQSRYLPGTAGGSYSRSATTDVSSLLDSEELRGLQDPQAASPIQENIIALGNENPADENQTVISVSRPQAVAVPDTVSEQPAVKPQSPRQVSLPVEKVSAKPAAKPAASAVLSPKKIYNDFWVQAGSFSTRERADGVKKNLDDKGVAALITNQQINDQTFYRVRVGPYTSRNEADYWLAMIKSIDGFEDSQIWESQSRR
ncbi:MAG: SPOR domain-containing protein [Treponema sp.]|jgi:DedD protein|nr:SPOR domain-containing protein [Treponema sp.]